MFLMRMRREGYQPVTARIHSVGSNAICDEFHVEFVTRLSTNVESYPTGDIRVVISDLEHHGFKKID